MKTSYQGSGGSLQLCSVVSSYLAVVLLTISILWPKNLQAQSLPISDFVLFAGNSAGFPGGPGYGVHLGSSNTIQGGTVGSYVIVKSTGSTTLNASVRSAGAIEFASSHTMTGNIYAGNSALISPAFQTGGSYNLTGNIFVNGNVLVGGGSVNGQITIPVGNNYSGPAPTGGIVNANPSIPTLPSLPIPSIIAPSGSQNITGNASLSPGSYGNITLGGNKTITFNGPGDYIFNSINNTGTSNAFKFNFQNQPSGLIRILVHGNAIMSKFNASIINGGGADRIYMEVQGSSNPAFSISNGSGGNNGASRWFGTIYAPYGSINMGSGTGSTQITGALWSGNQVVINSGVTTQYIPLATCTTPQVSAGNDKVRNCGSPTVSLDGSSTTPGVIYSWSGPGIVSGASTPNPVVNVAGVYTLTVSVLSCSSTDEVLVTDNFSAPGADAGNDNAISCATPQINLNGSSPTNGVNYSWNTFVNGNIVSGSQSANPVVDAIGTYVLTVTDPANGCNSTDTVIITEAPCILPYYQPCPNGKDLTKLGCELSSLYDNYILVGTDTIQQIFVVQQDTVWIEIITLQGQTQNLFNLIYQTPGFGFTDTIPNGLNPLVLTGRYPIVNLPNLLLPGIEDKIVYIRPVYPSVTNSGVAVTQGDIAQGSDKARFGLVWMDQV